jgi:hypothetical protein
VGAIDVGRSHGYCHLCRQPQFAADQLLGIAGWLSARARALADRVGVCEPFRQAETLLLDLAGWKIDAETIRRYCHQDAAAARASRSQRQVLPERFAQARGERELHIDAGKVNTPEGWRDVKVAVFACRERAQPATTRDYEQRDLPKPSVRSVIAAIEEAQQFGRRCTAEAKRLGVQAAGLSTLGDGAEWVWNLVEEHFPDASQLLDVYHGCEKLAKAGRAALGEGEALQHWLDGARGQLLGDGYVGVSEVLATLSADAAVAARLGATAGEVLNYFCGHQGRLGYALRLRRGQAIGSGLVEGTIKQRVNLRMKRAAARWRPEHVGPFVELLCLADSPEWQEYLTMAA